LRSSPRIGLGWLRQKRMAAILPEPRGLWLFSTACYTHKAEFLEERRMIMTWWSRFLEANREDHVTPHEFAKQTGENVTRLRSAKRTE
ncbi:hypothetical protein ACEOOJ_15935, partial [Pseudomonas aeruginosa]